MDSKTGRQRKPAVAEADWELICLDRLEADSRPGRWVWASDGMFGFARLMFEGETVAEAITEFETAGERCEEWRVYRDGVEVDRGCRWPAP